MDTSDDPVTAAIITGTAITAAEAAKSSGGGGSGISTIPIETATGEEIKGQAEGMMAESPESKKYKKRAAASILTKDWPLNLGIPGLLGRLGG